MKEKFIKFCEWMLDIIFIVCMELIQLCTLFICILSYESGSHKAVEWELCITIVINISIVFFIRHTAIRGMPSRWINRLISKE